MPTPGSTSAPRPSTSPPGSRSTRSSRPATGLGDITRVIHAAGVSPSQAPHAAIFAVDLYGTAVVLEELGNVIAAGGSGVVIASQSGHRLPALTPDEDRALATTPADQLLDLPSSGTYRLAARLPARQARQLAARQGRGVRWAERGAASTP